MNDWLELQRMGIANSQANAQKKQTDELLKAQNQTNKLLEEAARAQELKKSKGEKAEGPPCPACGLTLPADAGQKKYIKCGSCQSDLTWSVVNKGCPAVPQIAKCKPKLTTIHCPHCGGDLPEDARSQRYRKCRHCSGDLHWHDGSAFRDAEERASFITRQNNRRIRSQGKNAVREAEIARRKFLRTQGTSPPRRVNDKCDGLATTHNEGVSSQSQKVSAPPLITAAAVMALRERTGMTMMECKEAIEACGGDSHTAEIRLTSRKSKR